MNPVGRRMLELMRGAPMHCWNALASHDRPSLNRMFEYIPSASTVLPPPQSLS